MFSTSRNPDGMQPVNPLPPRYRWARLDSLDWWTARYDRPLERSACVACLFQSRQRWVETKRRWPELFAEAWRSQWRLSSGRPARDGQQTQDIETTVDTGAPTLRYDGPASHGVRPGDCSGL